MINLIYRDLISNVDVIQKGDQYFGNDGKWYSVVNHITMIYDYDTFHVKHRRLDKRKMFLVELLNDTK